MLCSSHWQLLPQTPTTNTATRRMEHIAELELLLARFWLPFGFGERKTNKKKRPNKPKPCRSIFLTLPAAAGTGLVSLGPKQTAPSCKATVGTSTAGTVSAGTAVPGAGGSAGGARGWSSTSLGVCSHEQPCSMLGLAALGRHNAVHPGCGALPISTTMPWMWPWAQE